MAKLSEVVGAILGDVLKARANCDMLTREVAQQYLKDPLLRLLPVPRADVKSISLSLKFCIEAVDSENVKWQETLRSVAQREFEGTIANLMAIPVSSSDGAAESRQPIRTILGVANVSTLMRAAKLEMVRSLDTHMATLETDETKFAAAFGKELSSKVVAAMRRLPRIAMSTAEAQEIRGVLMRFAVQVGLEGLATIENLKTMTSASASVAVEKEKLAEVPESAVSSMEITIGVENYDWVSGEEIEGVVQDKLIPR